MHEAKKTWIDRDAVIAELIRSASSVEWLREWGVSAVSKLWTAGLVAVESEVFSPIKQLIYASCSVVFLHKFLQMFFNFNLNYSISRTLFYSSDFV